jgi:hypothetical protein
MDLTNVAIVSCGVPQAQTGERNGTAIDIRVMLLLFETFPSLYNTPHTTPRDLKRGGESRTAIPQSTRSTLSTPRPAINTSSAFSSALSRCLDLLVMFREGRALPTSRQILGVNGRNTVCRGR